MVETIKEVVASKKDWLVEVRRYIHANPELSFHEEKTAAFVCEKLDEMGISYRTNIGGHGVVAEIGSGDRVIALRGDMDALPIQEENQVPYASKNTGVMHACGHDVHTTCMLGAAGVLKKMEAELNGVVRIIFQPAEEKIPGGASLMIADGVLKNPDVELIFGQHVFPDMEVGGVGFKSGMYMASADELYIHVEGKGGHAALPNKAIDPILIGSHLVVALQQMVSRKSRPDFPTVLTIGKFEGLGATNVIPKSVKMEGTLRAMNEEHRADLHHHITKLVTELCSSMGAVGHVEIRKGYPCLVNDDSLTNWAKEQAVDLLGAENVHDLPLRMTAEDFAYFAQEVPACFYRLGTSNKSKNIGAPLHTSTFDVDEDSLVIGTSLMSLLAIRQLA